MTPKQMRLRILRQALKKLVKTRAEYRNPTRSSFLYICDSIQTAATTYAYGETQGGYEYVVEGNHLRNKIQHRLQGLPTLEKWLVKQGLMPASAIGEHGFWGMDPKLFNKMQRTRVAWIEALIAEEQRQ